MAKRKKKADHWPKIRAALIAYLIVFNVLAAIPMPGSVSKETLARPNNRAELKRWVGLFLSFGIDTDEERLGAWYIGFADDIESVHAKIIKPIWWWMELTQTWQGWRLFGMPDERPYALQIAVVRAGKTEVLYESGTSDYRWNASLLEYRRMRALYNPGAHGPPTTYRGFSERISEQIFEEMPDVDIVKIALLQSYTTLPGEPEIPDVEVTSPLEFRRK